MAKKKKGKKKEVEERESLFDVLGVSTLFWGERISFVLGAVFLVVGMFMIASFVSFFMTGQADISVIEDLRQGEFLNENHEFQNVCGSVGSYTAYFFVKRCFGLAAFAIPVFLLLVGLRLMRAYYTSLLRWFLGLSLLMLWSSITMAKFLAPLFSDSAFSPGGDHGLYICQHIEHLLGAPGLTAILILIALAFFTYVSAETIYFVRKLLNPKKFFTDRVQFTVLDSTQMGERQEGGDATGVEQEDEGDPSVFDNPQTQTVEFDDDPDGVARYHETGNGEDEDGSLLERGDKAEKSRTAASRQNEPGFTVDAVTEEDAAQGDNLVQVGQGEMEPYDPKRDLEFYHYPTLDLLTKYESDGRPYIDMAEQTANKNRIVEVLRNFGVEISSIKATVGPTITLYEITPAQGVRISKIRNLEDDIALSLSALGIRIIAPIPGKGTIGIEVPNAKANIVSMESILNSKKFQETTMELPCAIGKTITNEVFMFDLAKTPHLLVAGATGQGKSVGLNAILTSLLYKKHPAELKIVMVDPKMVEFSIYSKIKNHFLAALPEEAETPIITDTTKVVRTLNSLCVEMDARYELLMAAGQRNIKDYNKKFIARQLNPQNGHRYMPYIVVVIDEFGDLIMTAGKEIEMPIARIAQKARAVGIHMIIATQRPTTNIITGTIKANFPGRIAFKVSAGIDSKTILDRTGAQQLIGRGDMLFLQGNDPVRVQCAFVDTPEVDAINQFIAQQQGYLGPYELPEPIDADGDSMGESKNVDLQNLDPMFDDAARLIVSQQQGSTSLLQRKFEIGYNRAGRLMDQLEKAGIVGTARGAKPREVLLQDEMSLMSLLQSIHGR